MTAPQTPTPGVPLSAEAVGYVREYWDALCDCDWHLIPEGVREGLEDRLIAAGLAEWRSVTDEDMEDSFASERGLEKGGSCLDLTPLGYLAYKADAEGWMPWSGGENPVAGEAVETRRRDGQVTVTKAAYTFDWFHSPRRNDPADIVAFRLTTPSDQGEEGDKLQCRFTMLETLTPPSSGSDGLADRLSDLAYRIEREPRVNTDQGAGYRAIIYAHEVGGLLHAAASALVTREAAEKRIAELNAEVERWKSAYDIAHDQAAANGSQVAALKAALEGLLAGVFAGKLLKKSDATVIRYLGPTLGGKVIAARQALALKEGR